jgi:hypothetical protein
MKKSRDTEEQNIGIQNPIMPEAFARYQFARYQT